MIDPSDPFLYDLGQLNVIPNALDQLETKFLRVDSAVSATNPSVEQEQQHTSRPESNEFGIARYSILSDP